ncbi:TPA: hypothetical protein HA265_06020, partial [Candidatus Woesearchaeota archaeon]|nr:hypothetical protein [Candidatus Woesearchaeota archaeon]
VGLGCLFYMFGLPQKNIVGLMKESGFLKVLTYILITVAVLFGFSQLWGDRLLEDQTVSFADQFVPAEENVEIDFAPLFTKQAAGMMLIVIIVGAIFFFVNLAK